MANETSAVIADAHAIFRRGLGDLLAEAGMAVVGEAEDLTGLITLLRQERPRHAFVDTSLVDRDGLVRLRHALPPDCRVVFLVEANISASMLVTLVESGAAGCIERNLRPAGFARAVAALERGEVVLSRALTQRLCAGVQRLAERQQAAAQAEKLTPREREVLRYVSQAARNRDIATALSISEHTVKRHVQNILQKLDLPTRVAAATFFERTPLDD